MVYSADPTLLHITQSPVEFTFISFVFRYFEVILKTVNGVRVVIPSSYVMIWLYLCKLAHIHYAKIATLGYVQRDLFSLFICSCVASGTLPQGCVSS